MERLTFEERYQDTLREVDKREASWDLAAISWADARQMILIRISQKYHLFDPNKTINGRPVEYTHWVQRVISRAIYSIWRDNLGKMSRPCIGNVENGHQRCVFNAGEDLCTKTPSGKQCAECPLYKDWERRKKDHHAVKHTLSLDHHSQEVSSIQADFLDIDGKKQVIDAKMKERLPPHEWRVYKLLFVKGGTDRQAAKLLGFKDKRKTRSGKRMRMFSGYSAILKLKHRFVAIAKQIIEENDLA